MGVSYKAKDERRKVRLDLKSCATVIKSSLVPKLQLGNPEGEALGNCSLRCSTSCIHAVAASRDGKLELPALNSQAGAWELALNLMTVKRSAGTQPQPSMPRSNAQRGFTLLELTVVLFVVVLGFSVIGLNLSSGNESTEIKAAARDIVSALRYARGQALMTHRDATLDLDLTDNSYTVSGRNKTYPIPEGINVTVVTAQTEVAGKGMASIRFFADGSSTGGRITLERGNTKWKIDINWLTGQVELENE